MARKCLVFIVHGVWASSWAFTPLLPELWSQGLHTWSKEQPFALGDAAVDLSTVIRYLRAELETLCNADYDIIMLAHSFGTYTGPSALDGFWKGDREAKGQSGGIVGMIYASCPILPRAGMTPSESSAYWQSSSWFQGRPLADIAELGPLIRLKDPSAFAANLAYADKSFMLPLLTPSSARSHNSPIEYDPTLKDEPGDINEAGRFRVPTVYLVSLADEAIPTAVQLQVVKKYLDCWTDVWSVEGGHLWAFKSARLVAHKLADWSRELQK